MVEIEADRDTSSGVLLFASFALEVPPAYSMISDNSVCAQNPAILSEVAILRQRLAGVLSRLAAASDCSPLQFVY